MFLYSLVYVTIVTTHALYSIRNLIEHRKLSKKLCRQVRRKGRKEGWMD